MEEKKKGADLVNIEGLTITRAQEEKLLILAQNKGKSKISYIKSIIEDHLKQNMITYHSKYNE